MLLHVGKLVDFDHARKEGQSYANTLRQLCVDGKRAQAVDAAIENGNLAALKMAPEHDWESMKCVLEKLSPTADSPREFCDWWNATVPALDSSDVLQLETTLSDRFSSDECRLECCAEIQNYLKGRAGET